MALIPCPECKREVSTRAIACPACGCPIAEGREGAAAHATRPVVDAGLLGKLAAVLGAWVVAPHVERTIGIVAFCLMAAFVGYFLFSGGR